MKLHVLTLFPEMILQGLAPSIIGRAVEKKIISLDAVNIRDFTLDKHGKVDDYTYGGSAGMLMQAQTVSDTWKAVTGGKKIRTIYLTPQGAPFTQNLAKELSKEEELIFLCGHYEGIDERVLEEIVTDYVSIGDYVLTGGELPAMVMIDAVARLVPGVLGNDTSAEEESFHNDLLEYPQYSRPEIWHEKKVPEVLLSGNHAKISKWRLEQSEVRTAKYRPDLYQKYQEKQRIVNRLSKEKRKNIHIMESLSRGKGEVLYWEGSNLIVFDREASTCMLAAENTEMVKKLSTLLPKAKWIITNQDFAKEELEEQKYRLWGSCNQYLYTARETLTVRYKEIRNLTIDDIPYVSEHYKHDTEEYIRERILAGEMYGAFADGRQVGFIGLHSEGSMGLLYVEEDFRRQGIAESLEAYCVNRCMEKGWTPYGHVMEDNTASKQLQDKLGFYKATDHIFWLYGKEK